MICMKLNDFRFLTDYFDENEIKRFETKNMRFSHTKTFPTLNRKPITKIGKLIYFTTDKDFDICFDFTIEKFRNEFQISIFLFTMKDGGWIGGFNEVFLPEYLDDLEPLVLYLEDKMKEVQKAVKQNKVLRLSGLVSDCIISVQDYEIETYQKIKAFKNSPDFEILREKEIQKLKKYRDL